MPDFFSTPVRSMTLAEVRSLYDQHVPENIRLEFKRAIPADDGDFRYEMVKALSSFANTFGGYFVVGIATDAQGNPIAMDGVDPVPGYSQKVVSVGYQDVYPPLVPIVSDPIDLGDGKACYVVYQELSLEAPHFLTKRRGAFVRTAEFTQTFSPQLATWDDLRFLANRREEAIRMRETLYGRSRTRMGRLFPPAIWEGNPATLMTWVSPAFPSRPLRTLADLQQTVERSRVTARQTTYPRGDVLSLVDTLAFVTTEAVPEYVESDVHGVSFSGEPFVDEAAGIVHGAWTLSRLLLRIRYGTQFLRASGYEGLVHVRAILFRVAGKRFVWTLGEPDIANAAISQEPEALAEEEDTTPGISADVGRIALRVFRTLAFGCGWWHVFGVPGERLLAEAMRTLLVREDFLRIPQRLGVSAYRGAGWLDDSGDVDLGGLGRPHEARDDSCWYRETAGEETRFCARYVEHP